MVRVQIIAPVAISGQVIEMLADDPCVTNLVRYQGAAVRPAGDVIVVDVAREETSAVLRSLDRLGLSTSGSISLSDTTELSSGGRAAAIRARGAEADAVVWEEVEERTAASAEISGVFLGLLALAAMIAALALMLESEILMVGAMVVGPEFGPLAGVVVGLVAGARGLARRSAVSLALGVPVAVAFAAALTLALRLTGLAPEAYGPQGNLLAALVSMPDWSVVLVATLAGVAGMLALTTAHAGALVGVLISVATVPSIAGMGVAIAYGDPSAAAASALQLAANIAGIVAAGSATLAVQRRFFARRVAARRTHAGRGVGS